MGNSGRPSVVKKTAFDDSFARTYRKRAEVLAFRTDAPFRFSKSWGEQQLRAGGWVLVPIAEDGSASEDVYGCDEQVFAATYEPSPSLRPHRYRKTETVRAYQPRHPFEIDTVLPDDHVEVENARCESPDGWIVRAVGGEIYPVENDTFTRTYVEVLERSDTYRRRSRNEHWAVDGTPKRILTLDGGGVRGILTLAYLEAIEHLLRDRHGGSDEFRLCHYYDLIAGTSTGATIAACLAKGKRVAEVRELYEGLAGSIFRRSLLRWGVVRAKFSAKALRAKLKEEFQRNTLGSSTIQTGLLIVAKRLDTGSIWPMSNNPGSPFFTAGPDDIYLANEDYPLGAVIRASTAAPHFFGPEHIEISTEGDNPKGAFVDGGVSPHNNPALLALQLVSVSGFRAGWALDLDKLLITSVGTGAAQPGVSRSWLAGPHAVKALKSLMDDCAELVEAIMQWLSDSPTAREIDAAMGTLEDDLLAERPLFHYQRYNVILSSEWLTENFQRPVGEKAVKKLQQMDRPASMPLLWEIGTYVAGRQVSPEHFPPTFDLG
jgi:hypothetical protein